MKPILLASTGSTTGLLNSATSSDVLYFYHTDHLGTPIMMTDMNQNVVWEGEFLPFGESFSVSGTVTNNLRFPGQYYDEETGLHQNWHRDYKSEVGRYLQFDPVLRGMNIKYRLCGQREVKPEMYAPRKLQPFIYATNNPVALTDREGLMCGDIDTDWIVPDYPLNFNFTSPCENHDDCYGCKGAALNRSKNYCDFKFLFEMSLVCLQNVSLPGEYAKCQSTAVLYYTAVRRKGHDAYRKGRSECCKEGSI